MAFCNQALAVVTAPLFLIIMKAFCSLLNINSLTIHGYPQRLKFAIWYKYTCFGGDIAVQTLHIRSRISEFKIIKYHSVTTIPYSKTKNKKKKRDDRKKKCWHLLWFEIKSIVTLYNFHFTCIEFFLSR